MREPEETAPVPTVSTDDDLSPALGAVSLPDADLGLNYTYRGVFEPTV